MSRTAKKHVKDTKTGVVYGSICLAGRVFDIRPTQITNSIRRKQKCLGRKWVLTSEPAHVIYVPPRTGSNRIFRHVRRVGGKDVYASMCDAVAIVGGSTGHLHRAVTKGQLFHGSKWEYTDDPATVHVPKKFNGVPFGKARIPLLVGKVLYPSCYVAAKKLKANRTHLRWCMRNRKKFKGMMVYRGDSLAAARVLGQIAAKERKPARLEDRRPVLLAEAMRVSTRELVSA